MKTHRIDDHPSSAQVTHRVVDGRGKTMSKHDRRADAESMADVLRTTVKRTVAPVRVDERRDGAWQAVAP